MVSGAEWRRRARLTFYETDVSGARTLLRILRSELDALTLAEQLENGAANRTPMKEVLDSTFIANEPETLVDQEPCDRAVRHTRVLRMFSPGRKVAVTFWRSGPWRYSGWEPGQCRLLQRAKSRRRDLPGFLFFVGVFVFIGVVFVEVGVLVKVFVINDFVVFGFVVG